MSGKRSSGDKWDNLLHDYKKVRNYEELRNPPEPISYWKMEKHECNEKGLPSNLLVYCAIQDVVGDHSRFPARKLLLPTTFDQIPAPAPAPGSPRQHFSPILQILASSLHSPMQKQHIHKQFFSEPDPTLSEEGDESSFEDAVADQIAAGAAAAAKRRKVHMNNVELEGSTAVIAPSMCNAKMGGQIQCEL
ncbi:unnamed protein product [Sphagnum balticum]